MINWPNCGALMTGNFEEAATKKVSEIEKVRCKDLKPEL